MKHPEAFVTENAWITGSELVIGCKPSANESVANATLLCHDSVLVHEEGVQRLVQTVRLVGQSDVCDDDQMFAVSLMTVEVGEAHLHLQLFKPRVLHLSLAVGGEVPVLRPSHNSLADVLTLWISHIIVENSLEEKERRFKMIFADEVWGDVRRVAELSTHLQVTDAADGVLEVCESMRARHQQSRVWSDVEKFFKRSWVVHVDG